jgi:hypothetical protein
MDMWIKGRSYAHANPAHKGEIIGSSRNNNVVDGIIEDGDRTWMVSLRFTI